MSSFSLQVSPELCVGFTLVEMLMGINRVQQIWQGQQNKFWFKNQQKIENFFIFRVLNGNWQQVNCTKDAVQTLHAFTKMNPNQTLPVNTRDVYGSEKV